MRRTARIMACACLLGAACSAADGWAEPVRRASCTDGEAVREIELGAMSGVADVCEVIERREGAALEERTPYSGAADSALCIARFERRVRALGDKGWRCAIGPASRVPLGAGRFAATWRASCVAAQEAKGAGNAGTLCDCAVALIGDAGVKEGDLEALLSPPGLERSARRETLLDEVGLAAVEAIARCRGS